MKLSLAFAAVFAVSSASAFVPASRPAAVSALSAAAAKSKEEDLELTRQVIAKFQGDDAAAAPEAKAEEPKEEAPKKKKKGKKSD